MVSRRCLAAVTCCLGPTTGRARYTLRAERHAVPLTPVASSLPKRSSPRGWVLAHLYFLRLRVLRRARRHQLLGAQRTFQGLLRTETTHARRSDRSGGRARTSPRVRAPRKNWRGRTAARAWRGWPREAGANRLTGLSFEAWLGLCGWVPAPSCPAEASMASML